MADSVIPTDHVEPNKVNIYRERVEYVGSSKENNISILLWNITFEDAGVYNCFGKNPKEKGKNHTAFFTLTVVEERKCSGVGREGVTERESMIYERYISRTLLK